MTMLSIGLGEVEALVKEFNRVRIKIRDDEKYREAVVNNERQCDAIRQFFSNFTSFLHYEEDVICEGFYRVRRAPEGVPFRAIKDLKYPEASVHHADRMNNISSRILYTSLHEFTAMAECRIAADFVGQKFQLTKFQIDRNFKAYRLGHFGRLYLDTPRDSVQFFDGAEKLLGSGAGERAIQGYSALEMALGNILYGQDDGYHILSSILADSIFLENPRLDAIIYPSLQNRYGTNVAFNKRTADYLKVKYTCLNRLDEVYANGFYRYSTELECEDYTSPDGLTYKKTDESARYQ